VINYSYLVTNTGNVTLAGPVTIADDKSTDESCPAVTTVGNNDANLDPAEAITCTASYNIVQADIDAGSVTNIASASANGATSPPDTATALIKPFPWIIFIPPMTPPPCPDEPQYCYMVSDRDNEGSKSSALLKYTFKNNNLELIGRLGVTNVEAITLSLDATILYATKSGVFGVIDTTPGNTSSFIPVNPAGIGTGNGALGWVSFTDIDGLAFDPTTGILYGSQRLYYSPDLLIQIDPATGTFIENAFGENIDYVVIGNNSSAVSWGKSDDLSINNTWTNTDDLAIDTKGVMYAVGNAEGIADRIVVIDKKTGIVTDPVTILINGDPLNDVEGLTYYNDDLFFGTTGIETNTVPGVFKSSFYVIELNSRKSERIIDLEQNFNGYVPYDFEAVTCELCRPYRY
jgi:hypothetical protein